MLIEEKENDCTCGTCKHGDYCDKQDELNIYDLNVCDDWEEDKDDLTEEEKLGIIGDRKAHEIMVEGGEIE